jgi:ankyrin repeat protein
MTPLQLASAKGRLKTVKVLLKYDTDIHLVNSEKDNALNCAVEGRQSSIVTELLRRGAAPTIQQQSDPRNTLTHEQLMPAYQRLHTFYGPLQEYYDLPKVLAHLILTFDGTNSLLPGYQRLTDTEKENW